MEFKTILVPYDFGEPAGRAAAVARALAARLGAELHLLYVVPNPYVALSAPLVTDASYALPPAVLEGMIEHGQTQLDRALPAADGPKVPTRTFVRAGDAREVILDHAARERVDLIVMGTHGRSGAAHLFLGSVAERVVRAATCPVLTVH
jgi:nucleotide-binding universal stress UspA family protein